MLDWHPNVDEWQHYLSGQGSTPVFASGGKARTCNHRDGDVGQVRLSVGHYLGNAGTTPLRDPGAVQVRPPQRHAPRPMDGPHPAPACGGPSRHRPPLLDGLRTGKSPSCRLTRTDVLTPGAGVGDNSGMITSECEVLVIGGGPAGSTAAALLAEAGRSVVLLEKSAHPRFHVGESLLPRNLAQLERLGVAGEVAAIGTFKPGAEFVDEACGRRSPFPFAQALNARWTHSYQVPRAGFDEILFRNAARNGAETHEDTRVTNVTLDPAGRRHTVTAIGPDGMEQTLHPAFILDATGRDTLLATQLGTKQSNRRNSTAAAYAHYRGAVARLGDEDGFITVHLADDGWFWFIPLPGDVMSVGFVGNASAWKERTGTVEAFLDARIARSPTASARLRNAERIGAVSTTGNYSYKSRSASGPGYMLIGDAFAFLDPVFSSGVLLAMTSGEMGADVAQAGLRSPAHGQAAARRAERQMRTAIDTLSWLVYRINKPVLRMMFMAPSNRFRMRDGLVAMLAGNLRLDWQMRPPVLAFKSAYYALTLAHRLGYRVPPKAERIPLLDPNPEPLLHAVG